MHPLLIRTVALAAMVVEPSLLHGAPANQFVDARVCARCHSEIADSYARTGMGRSFFRQTPANSPELTEKNSVRQYDHPLSDTHFSVVFRDGAFFQRRWQIGFAGKETNLEESRIDYVMGSGNHARSYLSRTPRGTLIELPLGWYAESGWGMSPGSDSDHPRTRRFVSYKCMFCHNGVPQIPPGNEEPGSEPVFSGLPDGIDCQRCHGPGANHVRTVETAGSRPEQVRASIVNPARLGSERRMEICMQCHLETSSGRIPATVVRFNRGPFSFLPGEPLDAFMLTFDHAPGTGHDDKFEAVSSVYRLRQSRCFLRSEGKLTCDTCHNPHQAPRGKEAVTRQDGICRQCHAIDPLVASNRHPASTDCAGCHMPKRRAEDTPGMVMTDHLIQRSPPSGTLLAKFRERPPEEYRGEVVPYYPSPLSRTQENALYLAVAQVGLGNNVEAGLPVLARELAMQKPSDAEFYAVLGEGLQRAGKLTEAVAAYEQAVRLRPASVTLLRSLAECLSADGQVAHAAEILNRAVQIAPADPLAWYRYGMLDFRAGRATDAVEKIRKAIAIDPSLPEQSRSLAEVLMRSGQPELALSSIRDALRTDPYDDAAWDLAGRLLSERGEASEALYDFEKAVRLRPGYGPHLYDYALALVRADRFDQAQQPAEASVKADPVRAEAHELLGGLFARKRQLPEAAREYRRALELRPDSSRTHFLLGNVLAAQGDMSAAAEHWRTAAKGGDAALAQQAAQALRQIGAR
jgi:predicted CXXCH cytochrome family protein